MRNWHSASLVGMTFAVVGCNGFREPSPNGAEPVDRVQSLLVDSNYTADGDPDLANPERGVTYWVGNTPSDPNTLENHFLYLADSCNTTLTWQGRTSANTSQVLKTWANTAVARKAAHKKVIFRPRYDKPGAEGVPNLCNKVEANSLSLMQSHVQAIAAMLGDPEIKPTVAFIEMGYLGSWGEWNAAGTSCGTDVNACRTYAPVLLAAAPGPSDRVYFAKFVVDTYNNAGVSRPVELRTPEFFKDVAENLGVASSRIGFYNDCFMYSSSDGGTFSRIRYAYTNYTDLYPGSVLADAPAAKLYMQGKAGDGSQGGETCTPMANGQDLWKTQAPTEVVSRLNADGFDYLHPGTRTTGPTDFRQTMINVQQWDTIKRRLGYSYQATQVSYPTSAAAGSSVTVSVSIYNDGFGRIPYDRGAYVVLRGPANYVVGSSNPKSDTYTLISPASQSNQSVRSWAKGSTTVFTQTFPAPSIAGTYGVHLYVPDTDCIGNPSCDEQAKKDYAVKLATLRNGSKLFDGTTGTNNLGVTLTVTSGGGGGCTAPSAGNLVANPGFDSTNVSAFIPFDSQIQVSYSSSDSTGCATSGSLLLTNNAPNGLNSGAYQCVTTVSPGATYNVGGQIMVPSGGAQGQAFLHFIFTNGANCTGSFVGQEVLLYGPSSFDSWQPVSQDGVVVPAGAVAMQVYGAVIKNFPNSLSYRANFDRLYATASPGHF